MGDIYGVGMEGYGVGMEGYGLGRLKGLSMRREWMGRRVLVMGPSNLYANGAVVILAEKGHFDVAKDVVTQHQNCLRKFYHNTDSRVLLYLARTHYEAEQWQECKRTLLRAILSAF
ncbi:hypothetical protein HPP92_012114 [Vanilla planifolia]|uniref:Uncharacterized protein n=1 Tax=Vanilla planifolia TaxID=51239 RepID=A0A835V528_VANPL|nr:hypothetical protein HPP92_012114 [Vanilla planifolia]